MIIPYSHESIRLTGRWDTSDASCAITTAKGSYIEFAFEGKIAVACFDIKTNSYPRQHLWIQIDGGNMVETSIDLYVRVIAKTNGAHVCRIIVKSGAENESRWFAPITGAVKFIGVIVDKPLTIPADTRPVIEFVGDSITEGVHTDVDFCSQHDRTQYDWQELLVYQNDVCATYAWLIAETLDFRPIFMGYGGLGVTAIGIGNVPAADISYPCNFDGSPITHSGVPKYIVINHGANDRNNPDTYLSKYAITLDVIRKHNPDAAIIVLSAFCGAFHKELGEMVERYNAENNCNITYIDSHGWVPVEPLHPSRNSHKIIASKVVAVIKELNS